MNLFRVFISSIMNPSTENLLAEHEAVRSAVDQLKPITEPWAFEHEPASPKVLLDFYLGAVKTTDLFLIIVGQHVTEPVRAETQVARDYGKPILAFSKKVAREPDTSDFLHSLNVKYDEFENAMELKEQVRKALGNYLLNRIRGESEAADSIGEKAARLRELVRLKTAVRVSPLLPERNENLFAAAKLEDGRVLLEKQSLHQQLWVPLARIREILPIGPDQPPHMVLAGRIQWLTANQEWQFFVESPDSSVSLHGLPKESSYEGPEIDSIAKKLQASGRTLLWSRANYVATRLTQGGHEVFYDLDGRFRRHGRPHEEMILLVTRPNP